MQFCQTRQATLPATGMACVTSSYAARCRAICCACHVCGALHAQLRSCFCTTVLYSLRSLVPANCLGLWQCAMFLSNQHQYTQHSFEQQQLPGC
jgi:hypothetical protein